MQERSEAERRATWPCLNVATLTYNKYEPLQINQVPYILAVTALILFRFDNRLFCPVLKSAALSRIPDKKNC